MKIVENIINLIVIPLGTLIFITTGIFAAVVSALIEYCVIERFFDSKHLILFNSASIAMLLVFCFEFTKLYLHFLHTKVAELQNPQMKKALSGSTILTVVLVAFSFICSTIFTITTLHLSSYNEETISIQISEIDSQLKKDLDNALEKCNKEYDSAITPFKEAMEKATNALSVPIPDGYGPQKTTSYMEKLREQSDHATADYNNAVKEQSAIRDANYEKLKKELTITANDAKKAIMDTASFEIAAQYDNPIISHLLTVLAGVLLQKSSYSRSSYLWFCIILGVLISTLLESIIAVSFRFLSIPMDKLSHNDNDVNTRVKNHADKMVMVLFKAFCAITVYMIILSSQTLILEKNKFWMILLAYVISIYTVGKLTSVSEAKEKDAKMLVIYQIRDSLLQGVVSFVGFMLLGFLFGNEAFQLNADTLAIGIGSAISGGIVHVPNTIVHIMNKTTPSIS